MDGIALAQMSWRIGLTRRDVVGAVPVQKRLLSAWDIASARKLVTIPEALRPQVVEDLDRPVVAGLAQGSEQDRDAEIQTQPHDMADRLSIASPAERRFVVELGQGGHPQCFPRMQQVLARLGTGFVGVGRGADVVAVYVDRVEGLHNTATVNPAGDDIGGLHRIGSIGRRMRPIPSAGAAGMHYQMMVVEDALNRTQARSCPIPFAILVLNRACPDACKTQGARPVSDQLSTQPENPPLDDLGRLCGTMMRRVRRRAKTSPGMTCVIVDPLVNPTDALLQFLSNRRDRYARAIQSHGHSTPLRVPYSARVMRSILHLLSEESMPHYTMC